MAAPKIIESKVIGFFAGEPMHSWKEEDASGQVRLFEEYITTVFSASLGREIGLTMVREVFA